MILVLIGDRFLLYIEKQKEPDTFGLLGSPSAGNEAGMTPSSDLDDQFPDLNESSEPSRARGKGKCNLRKSLAWDSAFFTSAGIIWDFGAKLFILYLLGNSHVNMSFTS